MPDFKCDNDTIESIILAINDALYLKKNETFDLIDTPQTSIHVYGAPRSGTTLLSQLILSHLDIGYVNNLIASFWKAPAYGIHLSKKLLGTNYISNFQSEFGSTNHILEPHEFSYFWNQHLNYDDFLQRTYNESHFIKWDDLKIDIYQMIEAYGKPIVFKSFLLGFHATDAVKYLPQTLFLLIKRNTYQNAYSILKLREKRFGNINYWASIKPHQYNTLKDETIFRQIIGQVYFLNYEYQKQLKKVPDGNKLLISYEDLCENPCNVLEKIHSKIVNFTDINFINGKPKPFELSETKISSELLSKFKNAEQWLLKTYPDLERIKC